jgi:O-antigen/teichoic acid export membrane protein
VSFGELGIINSTIGMVGVFAGFGLGMTATKYIAEFRDRDKERTGRILGLSQVTAISFGSIMALVLLIAAPIISVKFLNAPHLVNELRLGCVLLLLNALAGAQNGALAGFESFRIIAKISFIRGTLNFPFMLAGVWLYGLKGVISAMIIVTGIGCILNQNALVKRAAKSGIRVIYHNIRNEIKILTDFSLPAFFSNMMAGPIIWISHTFLVNQPNGYAEMGVFNAANQLKMFIAYIPSIMNQISLPLLSNMYGKNNFSAFFKLLRSNLLIVFCMTSFATVIISLCSPQIMSIYGTGFADSYPVLIILSISTVFNVTGGVIGQAIASTG